MRQPTRPIHPSTYCPKWQNQITTTTTAANDYFQIEILVQSMTLWQFALKLYCS